MDGHKGFLLFMKGWRKAAVLSILLGGLTLAPVRLPAASLKINLEIDALYNSCSNVDAVDPSLTTPTSAQYINALVGGGVNYRRSKVELGVTGIAGYTYYLSATGSMENLRHIPVSDYNYFRILASGWARYISRIVTIDLTDDITRTRSLTDVYGAQTDAMGERFLYTDNLAALQFRFNVSPKVRLLVKYSYDTLDFPRPENPLLVNFQPANSFENRGYFRGEYDFDTKNTVFLDVQAGQRIFLARKTAAFAPQFVDYDSYQAALGYKHRFNERSDFEVMGGAEYRHFFHEINIDLKDYTTPLVHADYNRSRVDKYLLNLAGEWGTSTFGQSLFFDYINASLSLKYYLTHKLFATLEGVYTRDTFSAKNNDRTAIWKTDRVDNIYLGRASLEWDMVQKQHQNVLVLRAGYEHRTRDSNLDSPGDFKIPAAFASFDTSIDTYFAEVDFLPMILIGH